MFFSSKVTLPYFRHFFSARFSIFREKSVAIIRLHFPAMIPVKRPVPQAHSNTSSVGETSFSTTAHNSRFAFLLMPLAKISYHRPRRLYPKT